MSSSSQWFDAFRDTGRPLLYNETNRLSAVYDDVLNILIYIFFSTLFVAFLVILPGIRKEVSSIEKIGWRHCLLSINLISINRSIGKVYSVLLLTCDQWTQKLYRSVMFKHIHTHALQPCHGLPAAALASFKMFVQVISSSSSFLVFMLMWRSHDWFNYTKF